MSNNTLAKFLFSAVKYFFDTKEKLGLTRENSIIRLLEKVLRVKNAIVLDRHWNQFDVILIFFEAKVWFQNQLDHAVRVEGLSELTTARPLVILKDCGNKVIFDDVLHEHLIYIVNLHIFLEFPSLRENVSDIFEKWINESNIWGVFKATKCEPKFNIVKVIYIKKNQWINKRFKSRK